MNFRSECDYFSIAVDMLFKFKRRADDLGLFASVDFSEIDIVPWQDCVNVRNKRMHVTDYLKPGERRKDGSSRPRFQGGRKRYARTLIGGRLDWAALGTAAKRSCRSCSRSRSRIHQSRERRSQSPPCQSASLAPCAQWLGTTNEWPSHGWSS